MTEWLDAEGNRDWDANAQEALEFSEDDKKLIYLMAVYDQKRLLLGKEQDVVALWDCITAADHMRRQLGMMT